MTHILPGSSELDFVIDTDPDSRFGEFAQFLANACTDWPTYNLREPRDLLDELSKELNAPLTQSNLGSYFKLLPASRSENWPHKLQASVAIMELFRLGGDGLEALTLGELISKKWSEYENQGKYR